MTEIGGVQAELLQVGESARTLQLELVPDDSQHHRQQQINLVNSHAPIPPVLPTGTVSENWWATAKAVMDQVDFREFLDKVSFRTMSTPSSILCSSLVQPQIECVDGAYRCESDNVNISA